MITSPLEGLVEAPRSFACLKLLTPEQKLERKRAQARIANRLAYQKLKAIKLAAAEGEKALRDAGCGSVVSSTIQPLSSICESSVEMPPPTRTTRLSQSHSVSPSSMISYTPAAVPRAAFDEPGPNDSVSQVATSHASSHRSSAHRIADRVKAQEDDIYKYLHEEWMIRGPVEMFVGFETWEQMPEKCKKLTALTTRLYSSLSPHIISEIVKEKLSTLKEAAIKAPKYVKPAEPKESQ